jgi:hypothetical protein
MATSTGRLSAAPDMQSVQGLGRDNSRKSEGPAATLGRRSRCSTTGTRDLSTLTARTNEGADVAKSTRGVPPSDRVTRSSGVNITPPTCSGPVTTTHTSA